MNLTLEGHTKAVRSLAFSPDGRMLASGSEDNTIKLWRVDNGRLIKTFKEDSNGYGVNSVAFSYDGSMLASGIYGPKINIWSVSDGKIIRTIISEYDFCGVVKFSPDGNTIASGDDRIMLWRVSDGKLIKTFESSEGHSENIFSISFNQDGGLIVSGSWDHTIKLWNVSEGSLIRTLHDDSDSAVFSPDGSTIATCPSMSRDSDNRIKLWGVSDGSLIRALPDYSIVTFSPDGNILASNSYNSINLWRVSDGSLARTLERNMSTMSLAFNPDGSIIANGDEDGTITLWELKNEKNGSDINSSDIAKIKKKKIFTEPEMVFVEGGTFQMGNDYWDEDEKPEHSVTVNGFYIGKYEVTQKEWKAIMGYNPSKFKGDDLPVEQVSWNEVQEFLKELNENTGKNYRLPTEAEWEYASQGGNKSEGYMYSGSNNVEEVAWHCGNADNKTHPVGTKLPNELGIYDMSGNVCEWCNDLYANDYYHKSPSLNPQGPTSGDYRVKRNGSYWNYEGTSENDCRHSNRSGYKPGYRNDVGFRVVRDV